MIDLPVRDCEEVRKIILGDKEKPEDRKWSLIGQSFGGFCAVTYLSLFPESLKEVFITGGGHDNYGDDLISVFQVFHHLLMTLDRLMKPRCVRF